MNPSYYYGYEPDISELEELEEILPIVAGALGTAVSISVIVGLVMYILRSVGLHGIAKRRGLNHPWLAWIPLGTEWIIGSVSDQYRYLVKNDVSSRRKAMVLLSLTGGICAIVALVFLVRLFVGVAKLIWELEYISEAELISTVMGPAMGITAISLVLMILGIVFLVLRCMCMYDLYRSCSPDAAVAFLVLGILFPFLEPIFLMVVRGKDLGMPPRRDIPYQEPEYRPRDRYQEPWL